MRYIQMVVKTESDLPVEELVMPVAGRVEVLSIREADSPYRLPHPASAVSDEED
jgi:hypothetical protein